MVELKPFNWGNVETHFNWNNDAELTYYESDYPHRNETFDSFVTRLRELNSIGNKQSRILEIISLKSNELIGVVDILGIDYMNNRCCVEITIGNKEYRNKGYGKAALMKTLNYCFNELGMHKVCTVSFDFNETWMNLVESFGFVEEGRLRNHVKKNNQYCDKIIFGILDNEFEKSVMKMHDYASAV